MLITALACIFTSCSAAIDSPKAEAEEFGYVTFGNGGSRTLNTEYGIKSYNELVWFYTAEKKDGFGKTGETRDENGNLVKERINDTTGLSGEVGPLSQGAWVFTLYAYEAGENQAPTQNLVYQGTSATIVLKGGETKAVPVSVSLQGDFGTLDFSEAYFAWFKETTNQVVGNGNVYLRINISGTTDKDSTDVDKTIIKRVIAPNYLISDVLTFDEAYGAGKFPAGYYTCTVQAYVAEDLNSDKSEVNEGSTYKASQAFGLRVYGNATTKVKGDLTEGLFAEVSFDVAKQDMKVFVPSSTGTTTISGINVVPDATTVTGVTKSTTVKFDEGALTAVANKTLQLDVKVTSVESANEKFNITGTDADNKSAFAGIDVTLWATDSTGSSEVNSFTEGKYATITTYIAKGLTGVAVKYNDTDKEQPIATANTGVGVDTTIADILTYDTGTALGYNPSTGLLRFKTNHFSEYYVLAKCVALNETTNVGYGDLQKAFDNAKDSDVIKLIDNITSTTGFSFNNNAKVTFDLNEKILKVTNDTDNNHRALKVTAGTLTIKNGTIDARNVNGHGDPEDFNNKDQHTQGIYGTVRVETANVNSPAKAILENLELYNNHLWGMSVKVCENSNAEVKNCNFISRVGGCIEAEGGIVNVESSSFSQEVTSNYSSYISTGIAVSSLGSITVNNTESFNVSGAQALYVYSSGGEIIVNGGNYSARGNFAVIEADFDKNNYGSQNGIDEFKNSHNGKASVVVVNDGNFVGSFAYGGNTEYCQIKIKGGTFSTNPSDYVPAFGYKVEQNIDVNFVVSEAPLEINNAQDLMNFAASVNAGNDYEGKTITLNADIDLTGNTWVPIGNAGNPFRGTFNGVNHKISNLSINGTTNYVGLFGFLDGGIVENIEIQSVSITNTSDDTGAAVGRIENNGKVSKVKVLSGSITGNKRTGGVVGTIKAYGTIENCTNAASVTSNTYNAGGIVGAAYYTESGKEMYITSCTNTGAVTSNGNCAGGIVGLSAANVTGCTNRAKITGSVTSIGGIVGEQKTYGSVTKNTNTGSVENTDNDNYGNGGIIGWLRYHGTGEASSYAVSAIISVTGNTNSGNVSGGNDAGGIIGTVYNSAVVTGNTNEATSLSGTTFAAGIVGNYQTTEKPAAPEPASNKLTFQDNTSSTAIENISASNKELLIYTNGNPIITPLAYMDNLSFFEI